MAKVINNPAFNEFVYTVLFGASLADKRGLPGKFQKAVMKGKDAKTFATKSSKEDKELILSHLGFEFFYVVARRGMALTKFRDILEKFETKKRVSALDDIAREGVFVTSDKEFLRLLGLMSQAIHHPSYYMNLELERQGYHIQKWAKDYKNGEDVLIRQLDVSSKALARTCLNANLMREAWPGLTGVGEMQLKILLYLYSISQTNITHDRLHDVFAGYTSNNMFAESMRALSSAGLVMRNVTKKDADYTISGIGVKQVNDYINRVINLNSF